MASGFNKVILVGNLTADPKQAATKAGVSVSNMTLAINPISQKHDAIFIDVVAFDKTAEHANQYLQKGRPILVDGRIDVQKWTDKEGNNRVKYCVIANNIQFLGSKDATGQGSQDNSGEEYNDASVPF